jgi:hypothetical protein
MRMCQPFMFTHVLNSTKQVMLTQRACLTFLFCLFDLTFTWSADSRGGAGLSSISGRLMVSFLVFGSRHPVF